MPAIALDLGKHLGYCCFDGMRLLKAGMVVLPEKSTKASRPKRRYLALKKLLADAVLEHQITVVYYELSDWHKSGYPKESPLQRAIREKINRQAQRSLGFLEATVEAAAVELNLIAIPVTVHDAKKIATKKGNASKEAIAKAMIGLYPELNGQPQDTLDAASVMLFAVQKEEPLLALKLATAKKDK